MEILEATLLNRRFDSYTSEDQQVKLLDQIERAHVLTSQTFDKKSCLVQVVELQNELRISFPFLTFEEIAIYFKKGITDAYGKWFGLNFTSYIKWIHLGRSSAERVTALEALQKAKKELEPKPAQLTEDQKEAIMIDSLLLKFEAFKKSGTADILAVDYDFLERKKVIDFTLERKNIIKQKVEKRLREQAIEQKTKSEKLQNVIDRLLEPAALKAACKRQAVKEYFDQLIQMDENLSEKLL